MYCNKTETQMQTRNVTQIVRASKEECKYANVQQAHALADGDWTEQMCKLAGTCTVLELCGDTYSSGQYEVHKNNEYYVSADGRRWVESVGM